MKNEIKIWIELTKCVVDLKPNIASPEIVVVIL